MMKFTPWQTVAFVTVMFVAIITSQVFAPGVGPTVLGMVGTLFSIFIEIQKGKLQ